MDDYLRAREDYTTEYLWVSNFKDRPFTEHGLKHFTKRIKEETDIKKFHVHRFRHTFAVSYYSQRHDMKGLNRMLGHKSLGMTWNYLRSLPYDDTVQQMKEFRLAKFK